MDSQERRRTGPARAFLEQALELAELVAEALDDHEPDWPRRDPEDIALALLLHDRQREDRNTFTMTKFLDSEAWAEMVKLAPLFEIVAAYERLAQLDATPAPRDT